MTRARRNIDTLLTQARVALDNVGQMPEVAEAIATFGYDDARMQEGYGLLEQAEALQAQQAQEYSEQYQATAALKQARAAADEHYSAHRKLARLALKRDPKKQEALGLGQPKKLSLSGWLGQANIFYTNALANSDIQEALARFNITPDRLAEAQSLVQQVADLNSNQEIEKYEAQQATQERDAALDALDEWYVEFKEVAEIALNGQGQQLEALGFGPVA